MGQWYLQRSNLVSLQQSWGLTGIWIVRQRAWNIHPPTHTILQRPHQAWSMFFFPEGISADGKVISLPSWALRNYRFGTHLNGWISLRQYTQGVWVQRWKLYPAVQTASCLKKSNWDDTLKTLQRQPSEVKKRVNLHVLTELRGAWANPRTGQTGRKGKGKGGLREK